MSITDVFGTEDPLRRFGNHFFGRIRRSFDLHPSHLMKNSFHRQHPIDRFGTAKANANARNTDDKYHGARRYPNQTGQEVHETLLPSRERRATFKCSLFSIKAFSTRSRAVKSAFTLKIIIWQGRFDSEKLATLRAANGQHVRARR
jgi:hypothetical protein